MDARESTPGRNRRRSSGLSAPVSARQPDADSWHRAWPQRALDTLDELDLSPLAAVLDVGDGDAAVAEGLIARGFVDVTALAAGRAGASSRRGEGDLRCPGGLDTWRPPRTFDVWHDRSWLQFRLPGRGWQHYLDALRRSTHRGSLVIISSFTPTGERWCARSPMRLASDDLALLLGTQFARVAHRDDTHLTACGSDQAFQWSAFERLC